MLIVGPYLQQLLIPVGAIILALLVGAVFILLIGKNPIEAYIALLQGAFGDVFSIGETLENTTPLILTGLAVAFAFRAKLFNIGAEGQFLMGALAATWVGTSLSVPSIIHIPLVLLAGIIVGGLWGGLAGLLKATRGVHEVISTIMLNFIAIFFISYMVTGPMKEVSALDIPQTARMADTAQLMKIMPPSRLSAGIIIALLAAGFIWWLLWKTTIGYEVRAVGLNFFAAEFGGIKPNYNMFLAMLISGGLAGLGGAIIISGLFLRYQHCRFAGWRQQSARRGPGRILVRDFEPGGTWDAKCGRGPTGYCPGHSSPGYLFRGRAANSASSATMAGETTGGGPGRG